MSGAGLQYAGQGPAGEDDVAAASTGPVNGTPRALDYNRGTFVLDAAGNYGSIHPIDQRIRLALLNTRYRREGERVVPAIPAAPDQGFDWTSPFAWGEKLTADVTNRIRDALERAGLQRDIDYAEVRIQVSGVRNAGRVSWIFAYRNLYTSREMVVPSG